MNVVVSWKWSGGDARWAGVSAADRAALEVGLRLAGGGPVTVVSVGSAAAEAGLRAALAAGATAAVRVDAPDDLDSQSVARALAPVVATADWVVTGDASDDRGTGAVPAFLAAATDRPQALGLVAVGDPPDADGSLTVTRRLDGGRREVLAVSAPAVLSVEGAVAQLRRAALPAELAARAMPIEVRTLGPTAAAHPQSAAELVVPYRPRARALAPPTGDALARVGALAGVGGPPPAVAETVVADPAAAADRILAALAGWGYR